jgi:CrcB protein
MVEKVIYVFLGGGAGSVIRFLISQGFLKIGLFSFPWATFASNALSCLLMVAIIKWDRFGINGGEGLRLLLFVGFLGGLSTFSTFSYETSLLMKEGHLSMAFTNV